jgi:hypothetical protein
MSEPKRLWMYRVLGFDDEGDPIEHGLVRASSKKDAVILIKQHLKDILETSYPFRLYEVIDKSGGILESSGYTDYPE